MNEFVKALGIDFGIRRVGVAVSFGTLAEPLEILTNDLHLFEKIAELVTTHHAQVIVVGISESKTAQKTIAFVTELEKHVTVPVTLVDETLSTQSARQKLQQKGMSVYEADKVHVDHLAAAGILQEWLDTQ